MVIFFILIGALALYDAIVEAWRSRK